MLFQALDDFDRDVFAGLVSAVVRGSSGIGKAVAKLLLRTEHERDSLQTGYLER
jgi:hypothetical protein